MLLFLLACGDAEPSLTERWHDDPGGVATEIAALPEVEQLAAVEAILVADPQNAGRLCGSLSDGPARQRCRSVQTRPHLWQARPEATSALPSPLADTPPASGRCDDLSSPTVCWSRHATGRASAGDASGAAGSCMAIEAGQWRQECMFLSAEALLQARGAAQYPDAISLCALAGRFVGDCLEHAVATLAEAAPVTPGGDWQPIIDAADMITARWIEDPVRGEEQRQALWALSTALVYVEAPAVSGAPLRVLPEDAHAHVRAAMAWRLVVLQPRDTLATLSEALTMASATHQDTAPPTVPRRALVGLPLLWQDAVPPEGAAVASWLGVSTRVVSPDPAIDGTIALLEAAARQPGRRALLEDGRSHPDPLVAWTAARLLETP